MERGIPHLVKFLRKLSVIKGDKNFLKRGEVDVIKFRPLIKILLIKILMNGTITGLSLRDPRFYACQSDSQPLGMTERSLVEQLK